MKVPMWLIIVGVLWVFVTWIFDKLWWVLVIAFIGFLLFFAGQHQEAQDEVKPDQPSAIMQWFKDHTPKK